MAPAHRFSTIMAIGLMASVVVYQSTRRSTAPAPERTPAAPDSGARELASLRAELARVEREVRRDASAQPRDPEVALAHAQEREAIAESREEAELRRHTYITGVTTAFHDEPIDPRWSTATTTLVRAALEANRLGSLERTLECRSRTCRVELLDDGRGTLSKHVVLLAQRVGTELPELTAEPHADGGSLVLYLSSGRP